jgi:hypothetical protein
LQRRKPMKAKKRDYTRMFENVSHEIIPIEILNNNFVFFDKHYRYIVGRIVRTHINTETPLYGFQMMLVPEVILSVYVNNRVWNLYMTYPSYKNNLEKYLEKIQNKNLEVSMIPTMITVDCSSNYGMGCVNEFNFYELSYNNIEEQVKDIMAKRYF